MINDTDSDFHKNVIEIKGLNRKFRKKTVLDNIDLNISPGKVFGLVGENGAGKTTIIKHLMGLLKAQQGSVRVFGIDPVKDPAGALSKIGYLSEERDLPHWMKVNELLTYTKAFYPGWDDNFADELLETFNLDPAEKIKNLSRGQKAQAALITALAYRPPLLLLDEPSSGLDPVVRRDILSAIIRTVADEGRTVFFSSHLLDEVERVADEIAIIHRGKIILNGSLEDIKADHHFVHLRFPAPLDEPPDLPGILSIDSRYDEWIVMCNGNYREFCSKAKGMGCEIYKDTYPTLEDIFVAYNEKNRSASTGAA